MTTSQTIVSKDKLFSGREELRRAQREYNFSESQLKDHMRSLFLDRNLIEDIKWFNDMFDFWFHAVYQPPRSSAPKPVQTRYPHREAVRKQLRKQIEQRDNVIRIKAQIALLSLLMPNGKQLGDCTFGEIAVMTGTYRAFLERLSRLGQPRQKIKTICSEARLLELWNSSGANNPNF
jgi:hypothetical protein